MKNQYSGKTKKNKKMNCNNNIKHTCSSTNYATCINFEGSVNTDSELVNETCLDLEQTTQDIYNQLDNLDLSDLGELCLSYTTVEGKNIVKNVLLKFEEKICELSEKVNLLETTDICNKSIVPCSLDFGDLVDTCGNQPTTLSETLQLILDNLNTP